MGLFQLRFDSDTSTYVKTIQSSQLSQPFSLMNMIRQDAPFTAQDHIYYLAV